MSLMTVAEVKTFLRLTDTTYDTLITYYIPIIEEDICEYLNNWFEDNVIYIDTGSGLAFSRGNTATGTTQADYITDDNQDFSTAGFAAGMDVVIMGGSNGGVYSVASLTTAVMTMTCTGEFIDQDQDDSFRTVGNIRISRMRWPEALKPIAAKMIWAQISDNRPGNVSQERIDDYSVTYAGKNAYPERVVRQLDKWRYARTG